MDIIRELFTLTPYQFVNIIIFLWLFALFTFVIFIFVTAISWKLFEKVGKNAKEAFIPIYNLTVLFQIAEIPSYYFLILLIPGFNIILIIFVEYKLAKLFNVSNGFMWGMILCPVVFIPMLAHGNLVYKKPEKEKFISVSDKMPTVLSQEQIDAINREEVKDSEVDNVFKSEIKQTEYVSPYKSQEVKYNQNLIDAVDTKPEFIERVEPVKVEDIEGEKDSEVDNVFKSEIKQTEYVPPYKSQEVKYNQNLIDAEETKPEIIKRVEPVKAGDIEEVKDSEVDNVFKSEIKQTEYVPPYKSQKVQVKQNLNDVVDVKPEFIKRVEPVKAKDIEEVKKAKFVDEDKIEIVEL